MSKCQPPVRRKRSNLRRKKLQKSCSMGSSGGGKENSSFMETLEILGKEWQHVVLSDSTVEPKNCSHSGVQIKCLNFSSLLRNFKEDSPVTHSRDHAGLQALLQHK